MPIGLGMPAAPLGSIGMPYGLSVVSLALVLAPILPGSFPWYPEDLGCLNLLG